MPTGILPSRGSLWALAAFFIQIIHAQTNVSDAPANGTETQTSSPGDVAADNAAGASGGGTGNLSTSTQIIIGVVVGVVSLLVITAGVLAFFLKKQKFDSRIKRYEAISAQHAARKRRPASSRRRELPSWRGPRPSSNVEEKSSQTPGEPILPLYNPAKYHESLSLGPGRQPDTGRRFSVRNSLPVQLHNSHSQYPTSQPMSTLHSSKAGTVHSPAPDAGSQEAEPRPTAPAGEPVPAPPRRPKPVLSKLITNL